MRNNKLTYISLALFLAFFTLDFLITKPVKSHASRIPASKVTQIGNEIFYYVVVDRFYDGDTNNNIPYFAFDPKSQANSDMKKYFENQQYWLNKMYDPTKNNPRLYHGGDLMGVIQKLDYLKQLGITSILLSPIMENVNGFLFYTKSTKENPYRMGDTPYHGYWTKDFLRIEEHFATPIRFNEKLEETLRGRELFKQLVAEAHKRGMKIMLDLAFNQTSPIRPEASTTPKADDEYFLEHGPLKKDGKPFGQYCRPSETLTCGQTIDTSGIYNPSCLIMDWGNKDQVEKCQLYYLADLNQDNPIISEYLITVAKHWIDLGADGFRMDAIKHISKPFLVKFKEEIKKYKSDTLLIGEYYDGGFHNQDSVDWLNRNEGYTMFDFSFSRGVGRFFTGNTEWLGAPFNFEWNQGRIGGHYNSHNPFGARSDDLITFINNHDLPRFLSLPNADINKFKAALAFLMTSRGIPKLIYGDEIGMAVPYDKKYDSLLGIGGDHYARPSMSWNWSKNQTELFNYTQKLITLRKNNLALRYGDTEFIQPENILSKVNNFVRGYTHLAMKRTLVSNNTKSQCYFIYSRIPQTMTFSIDLPDGSYKDLISSKMLSVKNGKIELDLNSEQTVVISNK